MRHATLRTRKARTQGNVVAHLPPIRLSAAKLQQKVEFEKPSLSGGVEPLIHRKREPLVPQMIRCLLKLGAIKIAASTARVLPP